MAVLRVFYKCKFLISSFINPVLHLPNHQTFIWKYGDINMDQNQFQMGIRWHIYRQSLVKTPDITKETEQGVTIALYKSLWASTLVGLTWVNTALDSPQHLLNQLYIKNTSHSPWNSSQTSLVSNDLANFFSKFYVFFFFVVNFYEIRKWTNSVETSQTW